MCANISPRYGQIEDYGDNDAFRVGRTGHTEDYRPVQSLLF